MFRKIFRPKKDIGSKKYKRFDTILLKNDTFQQKTPKNGAFKVAEKKERKMSQKREKKESKNDALIEDKNAFKNI